MRYDYVLIGNSTASTFAVQGIRAVDRKGSILIVGDEPFPAYGRPLLSYYLAGRIARGKMDYRAPAFYEQNNAEVLCARAERLDPVSHTVVTSAGEIGYGKALVATGSRAVLPPVEGLKEQNPHFFMKLEDALSLERELGADKRVLILGAGLIGLKCAEGIAARVKSIAVVDLADRILSSVFDEGAAELMQRELEGHGVTFFLGDGAVRFVPGKAFLKSGREIEYDILVVAVGVRPNTELVAEAGGEVRRGVVVDGRQETTLKDVYAAGDVCESFDLSSKRTGVLAILPNAAMQGECAGRNMAGGTSPSLRSLPVNSLGFFGLHAVTAGSYEGESYLERGERSYRRLFVRDNLLKGFLLVGDIAGAGVYTSLIRDEVPLDSVDFGLLRQRPALAAFPPAVRKQKLGERQ